MSKQLVSPFTSIPTEPIADGNKYPYLIVRLMPAVYQRERIDIRKGEPLVAISPGTTYVQHPEPLNGDGSMSVDCRALLLNAVKEAVQRTRFRMSVIWGERAASYVELDGSINASTQIPSGGIQLPNKLAFDQRVVTDFHEDSGEAK